MIKEKRLEIRNRFEMQNLGDFELIYPPQNKESLLTYYRTLQDQAHLNWEEFTTGRRRNPPTKFKVD